MQKYFHMKNTFISSLLIIALSLISCEEDIISENEIAKESIELDTYKSSNNTLLSDKDEEPDPDNRD